MLLKLLALARQYADVTIPTSWKTFIRRHKQRVEHLSYVERDIEYPVCWQMDKWRSGTVPRAITIRYRNPISLISNMLMDPQLIFGWRNHIRFKTFKKYIQYEDGGQERGFGDLMTSIWAEETERELLTRTEERDRRATLMPIILNSDGVSLSATNHQINTTLCMIGNCSDRLLNQPCSKACLGYIPKLSFSEEELINHLVEVAGMNKTNAKEFYFYFQHLIDREYWKDVIDIISQANKYGVYMRVLGVPDKVLLVYPYIVAHVGDEPGQKRMLGMKEGNATRFCIHCEYTLNHGVYDPRLHRARIATELANDCRLAESAYLKKLEGGDKNKKRGLQPDEILAFNYLKDLSINPWTNPLHIAPMGYKNNIFKTPYDLLHTFCGGIIKSLLLYTLEIIVQLNVGSDDKYRGVSGRFDSRLVSFPTLTECLPHVPQV